jgi:SET domain-containing protein
MTFEKGLIIDATRGSICRFVNHSCEPNCKVEKWTVNGEPRMALFAGEAGIMTGEELTYDYNFEYVPSQLLLKYRH